jgi:hypothetical protein
LGIQSIDITSRERFTRVERTRTELNWQTPSGAIRRVLRDLPARQASQLDRLLPSETNSSQQVPKGKPRLMSVRFIARSAVVIGALALTLIMPGVTAAQESPSYAIADDAVAAFYTQHGGVDTFGVPISREFQLSGQPVQLFENAALQVQPDGSVSPLPLTGAGLLPYSSFDGLTVPAESPAVELAAPAPEQPNYAARLQVFLQTSVPEPFLSEYNATGGASVWGLPTSGAVVDPNNPNFSYMRFQNGILFNDATSGSTQPLPLGSYVKAVLTGQNLPVDLARESQSSSLHTQTTGADAFIPDAA